MKSILENIPRPDRSGLRKFGLIMGAILMTLFGLLMPWFLNRSWPIWPWGIGGILWISATFCPLLLRPVYNIWMLIGHILGWMNTRIVLSITFYFVFAPIGLTMRLFGRDPMKKKKDTSCATYRIVSGNRPKQHLERPF